MRKVGTLSRSGTNYKLTKKVTCCEIRKFETLGRSGTNAS
jgi:hypothetical protein